MKKPQNKSELAQVNQEMRRKIIALLMSWKPDHFGTFDTVSMRYRPNMNKIYEWINQYGHKRPKWLNKYKYEELVTLVSQVTKITKAK